MPSVEILSEQDGVKRVPFDTTVCSFNMTVCGLVVAFYSSQQCVQAIHLPALDTESLYYENFKQIMINNRPDKILIFTLDITTMFNNDDKCVESYYTNARIISEYCPHNTHYYVAPENCNGTIYIYIDSQGNLPKLAYSFKKIDFYI